VIAVLPATAPTATAPAATAPTATVAVELGAWITIDGVWNGRELDARALEVLHAPRGMRFPRPAGEWVRLHDRARRRARLLEARARIMRSIRAYFDGRGFLEVETPAMVPSPGLDLHLDAFAIDDPRSPPRWLITSPEYQMKRLLAGGLSRIYQTCRCFRRNESGARHQPEFTMLEWYRALAGSSEVMADTEQMVASVAESVLGTTRIGTLDLAPPWERLTVEEAFARHAGIAMRDVLGDEDRFFLVLAETIEPKLGIERPVFLVEWPSTMASLARLLPDRPDRADRFEAFVSGVELCNGFGELVDPIEQRARLERDRAARGARGMPVYPLDERFLSALEEGIPPSGGNALGVDRLVMLLTGEGDIDDVIAFSDRRL
jgi:lysyl-tRNA synthetase class 2